jgi:bifunctional non-homologous end joining protein LigD
MARTKARTGPANKAEPRSSGRLATYEAKRDFGVTPEPRGSSQADAESAKKTARLAFVVQKHDARRIHYDVRLEIDGGMASWAVPKGPSFDPTVKRLAVQVEDHPMEYNAFEGRIPEGEYGAGDVLIWDRGTYETVPPGQEHAMMKKGHLHVRLFGEKLVGDWHFVRTGKPGAVQVARRHTSPSSESGGDDGAGGTGKGQWLFFKAKDRLANPKYDVVTERPESVASGRQATRGPRRVGASEEGKSARTLHEAVGDPMLAVAATRITDPQSWLFEVKYDGYRLLACKAGDEVRLYTRRSNDWTDRFRPIADAIRDLSARECVVDGEACVVDDGGRPSFHALQEWLGGKGPRARIGFAAFDLLWLDGRDVRGEPLESRRELLEKLLEGRPPPLTYSRAVGGEVERLLETAKKAGLEGLMAKRLGSPYTGGRSNHWLKLRFGHRQECAVVGWTPLTGRTTEMGALMLGVVEKGELVYAGRVGTGFSDAERHDWPKKLAADAVKAPPVSRAPKIKDARWVTPRLVVECGFSDWTIDLVMRFPRFLGDREDKTPMECVREEIGDAGAEREEEIEPPPASSLARGRPTLSNPDKVLFPRDGITKQDIWDYCTAIAPVMLAHLAGRPMNMQRYPDGIDGEEWFQHNAPAKLPPFIHLIDVGPRHGNKKRIVCDSLEALQWLANMASLTIHQWSSHVPAAATSRDAIDAALARPDYLVLDLDPGEESEWDHLVEVARAIHTLLDALKLEGFPKTSGKRGVHIVVPFAPGPSHDAATGFAEQMARAVAKVLPKIATVERMKDKRGGKLYVDYGQNGEGRTVVSPYTVRARDGAVVSTPIAWEELTEELDATRFTIKTVPPRIREKGDLFAGVLRSTQRLPG